MDMNANAVRNYGLVEPKKGIIYLFLKRVIDIIGAFVGLVLLSPLLVLVALAIKIEGPNGKIFFSQERCGKNNKLFPMYKFRRMISNAEE